MALSLSAEQKNIIEIFSNKDQYIIPPYQRPYSWKEDHCRELFEDLTDAFEKYTQDKEFGYFIGNIVLAHGKDKKDKFEVIDGQQRLTTITLLLKAMYHYDNKNTKLKNTIWILNDRTEEIIEQRLITNIFIEKDYLSLKKVLLLDYEYNYQIPKKEIDLFQQNICLFYKKLEELENSNKLNNFIDFFLYEVSLLPIQVDDMEAEKASDKALSIFETINDRGLSLSNSDIFKSTLYDKAHKDKDTKNFINLWQKFELTCESINYSMDRIFKIYTYKIRGENGIQSSEIGLREFFKDKKNSPFYNKKYTDVMNDLFDITDAIEFFNYVRTTEYSELTKWFQLIYEYTNNFPKDALLTFISKNKDLTSKSQLVVFSKSLVRYCYFMGSTTKIKNYIYKLTIQIMHNNWKEYYPEDMNSRSYDYTGRLYKGYALLGTYLDEKQKPVYPYNIKRIRDFTTPYWHDDYYSYDCIGNAIAIDFTKEHLDNIETSMFNDINYLKQNMHNWNNELHKQRQNLLIKRLKDFFRNPNED